VRDREQAIEAVQGVPLPFTAEFTSGREQELVACLGREGAEKIVDAIFALPVQITAEMRQAAGHAIRAQLDSGYRTHWCAEWENANGCCERCQEIASAALDAALYPPEHR
jgi:hypothetical protein